MPVKSTGRERGSCAGGVLILPSGNWSVIPQDKEVCIWYTRDPLKCLLVLLMADNENQWKTKTTQPSQDHQWLVPAEMKVRVTHQAKNHDQMRCWSKGKGNTE